MDVDAKGDPLPKPAEGWGSRLKVLGALLAMYAGILLLAGLLQPYVAALLKAVGWQHPAGRIFDRLRYLGLAVALPFLWKAAGLKKFRDLGWTRWGDALGWMLGGFFAACLTMIVAAGAGGMAIKDVAWVVRVSLSAAVSAVVVAFVEEFVFRGVFQRLLQRYGGTVFAIVFGSLVFAVLHGKAALSDAQAAATPEWLHGLYLAWLSLSEPLGVLSWGMVGNLFLFAAALALLYYKTGSLLVPMGLHSGAVLATLTVGRFVRRAHPGMSSRFFIETPATAILLAIAVAVALLWKPRPKES